MIDFEFYKISHLMYSKNNNFKEKFLKLQKIQFFDQK